jgi:hypothetical protein
VLAASLIRDMKKTLMMEEASIPETSANLYQKT